MEHTSTTQDAPGRRNRRLLAYCVGFVLLTNLLTVAFVFALRRSAPAPAPVFLERVQPATDPEPAAPAQVETRSARVTSRPEGAVVTYLGQALGTTPLDVALPVHAAAALTIEKEGYRPREVTVEPDQAKVHVRLVRFRERQSRSAGRPAAGADQAGQAEAGQADAPATQEPSARTPAADKPARARARRGGASSEPDTRTGEGTQAGATPTPDSSAE